MRKAFILILFPVLLFINSVCAETAIKAEVDKTTITTDEMVTYKIIVTSSDKNLPLPQIAQFEGLNIISQAESSTVSLVKSDIQSILVYTFILAPADVGKFKIRPVVIKINNKTYASDAFEIEVTPGKRRPKPPQKEVTPLPEEPQTESEEPRVTL